MTRWDKLVFGLAFTLIWGLIIWEFIYGKASIIPRY